MRDTEYATELARGSHHGNSGSEARIERLLIKESQHEEIRFSWWRDGKMMPRPLDLTEEELLAVLKDAIDKGVFSADFLTKFLRLLQHTVTQEG